MYVSNPAVSDALKERVRAAIAPIAATPEKAEEAVTYANWATDQLADVPTIIDQTAKFLSGKLDEAEKEELVAMAQAVELKEERHALYPQRIDRLGRKLGLVGTQ